MDFKRYLVLGTGVGQAVAYALLKNSVLNIVTLADMDYERTLNIREKLCRTINEDRICIPMRFVAGQTDAASLFKGFDVVISALPAKYNLELAEAAIIAHTNFCDLGGVVEITRETLQLSNKYHNMESSIVPDCGLMPGLGIIIAKKLMQDLGGAESIEIMVGGLPQKPRPPTFYQKVFHPEGLRHICYDPAPIVSGGEIKWVQPFSDYSQIEVPELKNFSEKFNGRVETFVTAGASVAAWSFMKWGVNNFAEKTVRWPGFVDFFKNVSPDQFEKMVATHVNIPVDSENPDLVWMRVTTSGGKNGFSGHKSVSLLELFDPETGLTAMQRTTGFTTAIIAEMIAEGKTKTGVNTPENAFDHPGLNEILDRVGSFLTLKEN